MFTSSVKPLQTTITYLEMTKPILRSFSRPANIQIALIRTENIPLHFYRYLQYQVGGKWHWVYRLRMSDKDLKSHIHRETTDIDVLYVDGAPSGFYEIDRNDPQSSDINYFGMMDHAIGKGLGKWFLAQAVAAAWENEPNRVTVNTCTLDHPAALGLYQRMGFSPTGQSSSEITPLSEGEKLALFD